MKYLLLFLLLTSCIPDNESWHGIVIRDIKINYRPVVRVLFVSGWDKDSFSVDTPELQKLPEGTWIEATYSKIYDRFTYVTYMTNLR